ncbi:hypothetical protein [Roseinatronobacter alkalisoli]|uniref:Uncharacterized protein n=1 Tax=Roseinatronobacter alkalisoli TaxID=3028235 RepID=A0ABT5TE62_9RHOB|nr:hypothetical protein [Roseinatronobacter sp. HJB301]MDD7973405.1 hypothetical protein [Roseinatronobacter sp. HJB301]
MSNFDESAVRLQIEWSLAEDHLAARYNVENRSSETLLVFDRLYRTARSGERSVVPDLAWRWLEADGRYIVAKYVPPIPEGMLLEAPELPYARLLPPGERLTGQVLLPVPLDEKWPYAESPVAPKTNTVDNLEFWLGYAWAESDMQMRRIKTDNETVFSVDFGWAKPRQSLLQVTTTGINLPMAADGQR